MTRSDSPALPPSGAAAWRQGVPGEYRRTRERAVLIPALVVIEDIYFAGSGF